jgi:hypothetical protein
MARRKPGGRPETGSVLFDVFYEDGSRASNRKVPAELVAGLDGDAPALTFITDQERRIGTLSGKGPKGIKRLVRSAG